MEPPPATPLNVPPGAVHMSFAGTPRCIADAREGTSAFLHRHARLADHTFHYDVLLVVSELVTNSVRYASGPLTLELSLVPGGVKVAVRDSNPTPPRLRSPDLTGGHGWSIVQRLCRRVRVLPLHDGKAVHAELAW
ncbi:ATP-binding protein [Streptomyces sp. NPDC051561]|uniref:ATP-binding protein n=1 Tax=Streptomyces sp. NPDC051561 TaxID=3365658 RepID=UPI0037AD6BB4